MDIGLNISPNFISQLLSNGNKYRDRAAYRYFQNNSWISVSWRAFIHHIKQFASALLNHGIKAGEHVAIYAANSPQWTEIDYACMATKTVSIAIHSTVSQQSLQQIIDETEPRLVFAGNAELAKKLEGLLKPQQVVLLNGSLPGCQTLSQFAGTAPREDWCRAADEITPDDLWTIVYTSGTTGKMRGAMLTYGNIDHQISAHRQVLPDLSDSDSSFCLLPLSHIFERGWSAIQYAWGLTHHYCPAGPQIIEAIKSAHPSVICVVPRILEKIYLSFNEHLERLPKLSRTLLKRSLEAGKKYAALVAEDKKPNCWLRAQHALLDKFIFAKVRSLLGGKLKHCVVGSAALVPDVHEFFRAIGIFINDGYGLTETTATISSTPLGHSIPNTVGTPLGGIEIRLGENDEIQVKGPNVMRGYYRNAEETAKVFTADGFFRTGDVGQFLPNGYLRITDRLKDFIRTSTGKYVAPQHLESLLCMSPYIDQAAIVGEGRSWIGALVVPDFKKLQNLAEQLGIQAAKIQDMLRNSELINYIQQQIDAILKDEAKHEQVHKIALLEHPFTTDNGELTPTLKLRRKTISEHYRETIEALFA
ncbi:MAG: long-chain fatty acid--CoA ligase [bacterium]|nr:long-chain fatty acid--CoA ligase [bacterium]